jgi:2-polyprenyl-3-methyl-5-hydroxy-6-metoxy-1,4-benzoquinol methylase
MSDSSSRGNPGYVAFHRPRFKFLMELVENRVNGSARILDVGPSPFTSMLRELKSPIDSLGLEPESSASAGHHYHFNLNDTQYREKWRQDLGPYDVIVFAEVLEHLFTAPELVLTYVRTLLAPGGTLILQTPNAVSLRKRIKLALGRNPFERLRVDPSNPGHFREYTRHELVQILSQVGFAIKDSWLQYYFDARFAVHNVGDEPPNHLGGLAKNILNKMLPGFLREGITILAVRI